MAGGSRTAAPRERQGKQDGFGYREGFAPPKRKALGRLTAFFLDGRLGRYNEALEYLSRAHQPYCKCCAELAAAGLIEPVTRH